MKKTFLSIIGALLVAGPLTAQEYVTQQADQRAENMPRHYRITYEQMTKKMTKELQLDEKQQKKVAKLNKKYKTLIEGQQMERPQGQRPPMGERPSGNGGSRPSGGMGGPGGGGFGGGMSQPSESTYEYDKQQKKYDKAIGKILTEQQYEGYLEIKPQFASQRKIREYLLGGMTD